MCFTSSLNLEQDKHNSHYPHLITTLSESLENVYLISQDSLDTDGESLGLRRSLSDQIGAAAVRLKQVVGLLSLHVSSEPEAQRKTHLIHRAVQYSEHHYSISRRTCYLINRQ